MLFSSPTMIIFFILFSLAKASNFSWPPKCFSYYKDLFPEGYIFETTKNAVNLLNRVTTSF